MPRPRFIRTQRVYDVEGLSVAFKTLLHDGDISCPTGWVGLEPYDPSLPAPKPKNTPQVSFDNNRKEEADGTPSSRALRNRTFMQLCGPQV
jgi:hypothetical protein